MVTDSSAPTLAPDYPWYVTVERSDVVFRLRDYFLRLGVAARVCSPTVVGVDVADTDDHDLEEYVTSWHTVNGIGLHLGPASSPTHVAAVAHEPESAPASTPPPPPDAPASPPAPSPLQPRAPRLGELLVAKGMLREEDLAWALGEARVTGELVGIVLLRAKLIYEEELARTLSEQLSIPYVSIMRTGVDLSVVGLLPAEVGAAAAAIPIRMKDGNVQVGFADPTDPKALAAVTPYVPDFCMAVAELSDIKAAWIDFNRRFGSRR